MIKENEFRIGNLVTIDNPDSWSELKDIPLAITGFHQTTDCDKIDTYAINLEHINKKPNTYYESYSQFIKFIKPIQLTDELFEKVGGKIDRSGIEDVYYMEGIGVGLKAGGSYYFLQGMARVECLHYFQNLFYVLNRVELIKGEFQL